MTATRLEQPHNLSDAEMARPRLPDNGEALNSTSVNSSSFWSLKPALQISVIVPIRDPSNHSENTMVRYRPSKFNDSSPGDRHDFYSAAVARTCVEMVNVRPFIFQLYHFGRAGRPIDFPREEDLRT